MALSFFRGFFKGGLVEEDLDACYPVRQDVQVGTVSKFRPRYPVCQERQDVPVGTVSNFRSHPQALILGVDVTRADRSLLFFESSRSRARLMNVLAVYAWFDPEVGYCQGMSDLMSPMVVLYPDDADAFWAFERLMRRVVSSGRVHLCIWWAADEESGEFFEEAIGGYF
ncbi:unnamed protein product [Closterium sp. NIES-53]